VKKKPSKDEFERKMKELDENAAKFKAISEDAKYRRKNVFDGRKDTGPNESYREIISSNIEEVKKFQKDKSDKIERIT